MLSYRLATAISLCRINLVIRVIFRHLSAKDSSTIVVDDDRLK